MFFYQVFWFFLLLNNSFLQCDVAVQGRQLTAEDATKQTGGAGSAISKRWRQFIWKNEPVVRLQRVQSRLGALKKEKLEVQTKIRKMKAKNKTKSFLGLGKSLAELEATARVIDGEIAIYQDFANKLNGIAKSDRSYGQVIRSNLQTGNNVTLVSGPLTPSVNYGQSVQVVDVTSSLGGLNSWLKSRWKEMWNSDDLAIQMQRAKRRATQLNASLVDANRKRLKLAEQLKKAGEKDKESLEKKILILDADIVGLRDDIDVNNQLLADLLASTEQGKDYGQVVSGTIVSSSGSTLGGQVK